MHVLEKFNSQEHEGHEITVTLTFVYSKWICSFWMLIHFFTKFKELHSKHKQTQWPRLQLLAKNTFTTPIVAIRNQRELQLAIAVISLVVCMNCIWAWSSSGGANEGSAFTEIQVYRQCILLGKARETMLVPGNPKIDTS